MGDIRQGGVRVSRRSDPEEPRRPRSAALLALIAILALILAAAAVPEGLSLLDESESDRLILPSVPILLRYLLAGVAALMLITLILLRVTVMRSEGKPLKKRPSRWRFLALLLVGVALWATFASYQQGEPTARDGDAISEPSLLPENEDNQNQADETPPEYSESLGAAVGTLFLLALVAMTVALLLLFRKEAAKVRDRNLHAQLVEELDAGVDDLRTIVDPREAVIACYSRMERVVELAGVEHRESDTPFELLSRLLLQKDVSEQAARRLTELFEEAKFSLRPIDETMRVEALEALLEVRSELSEGPVSVGVP